MIATTFLDSFCSSNEPTIDGQVSGRIHNIRNKSKIGFIVLRKNIETLQAVFQKDVLGEDKFKTLCHLPTETYITLSGKFKKLSENQKVKSCSHHYIEFEVKDFLVGSKNYNKIPIQLDEANNLNEVTKSDPHVQLSTKLNYRYFELRTPINNCIFKMKSMLTNTFRSFLVDRNFIEINTPKLIGTSSEGGSNAFKLDYFNEKAFLAQSPQLYKQMMINADFERVFEIGPVFRAENSNTNRHLCEFTGLDIEMEIPDGESYLYIIDLLWKLLDSIFTKFKASKEYAYIQSIYHFKELVYPEKLLIIHFADAVKLLNDNGFKQEAQEDFNTDNEKHLGDLVKQLYNSDLVVVDQYPRKVRPFYTMPTNGDLHSLYSNSYDIILRGEEICSGSQRIHDYQLLLDSLKTKNLYARDFVDYLDSFAYGSKMHGGAGFGCERVLELYLDLKDIRRASLFPRDPGRLMP